MKALIIWSRIWLGDCIPRTFRDAQCVVTTGHKVVKCDKQVGVTLGGSQQVLLWAPTHSFGQSRRVQSKRPVQGFCPRKAKHERKKKRETSVRGEKSSLKKVWKGEKTSNTKPSGKGLRWLSHKDIRGSEEGKKTGITNDWVWRYAREIKINGTKGGELLNAKKVTQ